MGRAALGVGLMKRERGMMRYFVDNNYDIYAYTDDQIEMALCFKGIAGGTATLLDKETTKHICPTLYPIYLKIASDIESMKEITEEEAMKLADTSSSLL